MSETKSTTELMSEGSKTALAAFDELLEKPVSVSNLTKAAIRKAALAVIASAFSDGYDVGVSDSDELFDETNAATVEAIATVLDAYGLPPLEVEAIMTAIAGQLDATSEKLEAGSQPSSPESKRVPYEVRKVAGRFLLRRPQPSQVPNGPEGVSKLITDAAPELTNYPGPEPSEGESEEGSG